MARGSRVMIYTCIGHVLSRYMKEADLTYRELYELTGISKSTLHGWTCGVVMENPDVLITLKRVFTKVLERDISTDDLLYGKDEDRQKLRDKIVEQEKELIEKTIQLAFFDVVVEDAA